MPFHSGAFGAIKDVFGGAKKLGRSTVSGIFDRIGLGAPPSIAGRPNITRGLPTFSPGSIATPTRTGGIVPGPVGLGDRVGQVLQDVGSGLSGLAVEAGASFLQSLVPTITVGRGGIKVRVAQRERPAMETAAASAAEFQGPRVDPSTGRSTFEPQTGSAGGLAGAFGRASELASMGGQTQQAGLGSLVGPALLGAAGGVAGELLAQGGESLLGLFSGETQAMALPATRLPGGAQVVGERGGFLGFGGEGGVSLPSGGFFFGASQNLLTGAVTVRPRNHLRMLNPVTGDTEHWLRAIPPPLRLWKIAGRHRRRSNRHP